LIHDYPSICYEVQIKALRFIEGHARLILRCIDGLYKAEFYPTEGPRFIPLALKGKSPLDAPIVTSRICGICFSAHAIASVRAVENAYNYKPNRGVELFRLIVHLLNHIQSNVMHLTLLSIPPLLGYYDNAKFRFSRIYRLGMRIAGKVTLAIERLGKVTFHTPLFTPFAIGLSINGKEVYNAVNELIEPLLRDLDEYVTRILSVEVPIFTRIRPLLSLNTKDYPKYEPTDSLVYIDIDGEKSVISQNNILSEMVFKRRDKATGLQVRLRGLDVMVGALPRILIHKDKLHSEAKEKAAMVNWSHNPFLNNYAQTVELVSDTYKLLDILDEIRDYIIEGEEEAPHIEQSIGVCAVEAPRGILVHHVEIRNDKIVNYKVVTPTAINAHSIERDAEELANKLSVLGREKLKSLIEDLVRAYDPCMSCSVSLDAYSI